MVIGHLHGISLSGKRNDAFPSGHAFHMGALASAALTLSAGPRRTIQARAVGISMTRIVMLAHWTSDVVAGFALGAGLERLLRSWTGFFAGRSSRQRKMKQQNTSSASSQVALSYRHSPSSAMYRDLKVSQVCLQPRLPSPWRRSASQCTKYAVLQSRAMTAGAIALAIYSVVVCLLLMCWQRCSAQSIGGSELSLKRTPLAVP